MSDPSKEDDIDPAAIAEAAIEQLNRENTPRQDELQNRQSQENKPKAIRKQAEPGENSRHAVNVEAIASQVITANPQAYKAFKNDDSRALDILVNEATRLSKAYK